MVDRLVSCGRHSVVFRPDHDRSVEAEVNKKTPCVDCENRYPACHDSCCEFKVWKAEKEEHKAKVAEGRKHEYGDRVIWNRTMRKRIMHK